MNKVHLICLLLLILCSNTSLINAQINKYQKTVFSSPLKKSEFLLYLAKNYSSNAYSILNKKTYDYYIRWATGNGHYRVLSSYAVVVHETCHIINGDIGGFWNKGYYISPKIEIKVSTTKVFNSSELDNIIPYNWKNKIFRYKTYMIGSDEDEDISSITDGIYGLMDEFDAYYQSTRAVVELYPYYKSIAFNSEPYYLTLYISNCYSAVFAYNEFRLFIAWYLKYAKKNHPDIYQAIIKNKKLKAAYTLIDNGYEKVVKQYFINRKDILDNMNKVGKNKAEITDKYFEVTSKNKNGNTTMGYAIPDGEIKYLNSLFTIEDYLMLKMLSIENLNESNYKDFYD